jgi:hypothetical protein
MQNNFNPASKPVLLVLSSLIVLLIVSIIYSFQTGLLITKSKLEYAESNITTKPQYEKVAIEEELSVIAPKNLYGYGSDITSSGLTAGKDLKITKINNRISDMLSGGEEPAVSAMSYEVSIRKLSTDKFELLYIINFYPKTTENPYYGCEEVSQENYRIEECEYVIGDSITGEYVISFTFPKNSVAVRYGLIPAVMSGGYFVFE